MEAEEKRVKACGFLIVRGQPLQEFLLMIHPDRLDLPKGHVEPGESELACAVRELEEETGIKETDIEIDPRFRFTTSYNVWKKKRQLFVPKTTIIFLATLTTPVEIVVTEHEGYAWHRWNPPHQIQAATIDPLLASLDQHLGKPAPSRRPPGH